MLQTYIAICFSKQLHTTLNQVPRKTQVEDHSWINHDQRKAIHKKSHSHRSTPTNLHHQELHMGRPSTARYPDPHTRNGQPRHFDQSPHTQGRTFVDELEHEEDVEIILDFCFHTTNSERILSVSGKLHCSRCNEELGRLWQCLNFNS